MVKANISQTAAKFTVTEEHIRIWVQTRQNKEYPLDANNLSDVSTHIQSRKHRAARDLRGDYLVQAPAQGRAIPAQSSPDKWWWKLHLKASNLHFQQPLQEICARA